MRLFRRKPRRARDVRPGDVISVVTPRLVNPTTPKRITSVHRFDRPDGDVLYFGLDHYGDHYGNSLCCYANDPIIDGRVISSYYESNYP